MSKPTAKDEAKRVTQEVDRLISNLGGLADELAKANALIETLKKAAQGDKS